MLSVYFSKATNIKLNDCFFINTLCQYKHMMHMMTITVQNSNCLHKQISLRALTNKCVVFVAYRALINLFLVVDLLGCCCVYIVFVATNIKQVRS